MQQDTYTTTNRDRVREALSRAGVVSVDLAYRYRYSEALCEGKVEITPRRVEHAAANGTLHLWEASGPIDTPQAPTGALGQIQLNWLCRSGMPQTMSVWEALERDGDFIDERLAWAWGKEDGFEPPWECGGLARYLVEDDIVVPVTRHGAVLENTLSGPHP